MDIHGTQLCNPKHNHVIQIDTFRCETDCQNDKAISCAYQVLRKHTNNISHFWNNRGKDGWKPAFKENKFAQQIIAPIFNRPGETETVVQVMMRKDMEPQTLEI